MLQLGDTVHTHLETLYISSCTFYRVFNDLSKHSDDSVAMVTQ